MPLPAASVPRFHKHTRSVSFAGFARADGLWDIEAHLTDIKPIDLPLASGVRAAGNPVHDMWIHLTIDPGMNIVAAEAHTDAMPYAPYCAAILPQYGRLVGLNLLRGFRKAVQEHFGDVRGCTHLTELLLQFPTAAVQSLSAEQLDNRDADRQPFQLDRCHALDTGGAAVSVYYPRWSRAENTGTD